MVVGGFFFTFGQSQAMIAYDMRYECHVICMWRNYQNRDWTQMQTPETELIQFNNIYLIQKPQKLMEGEQRQADVTTKNQSKKPNISERGKTQKSKTQVMLRKQRGKTTKKQTLHKFKQELRSLPISCNIIDTGISKTLTISIPTDEFACLCYRSNHLVDQYKSCCFLTKRCVTVCVYW